MPAFTPEHGPACFPARLPLSAPASVMVIPGGVAEFFSTKLLETRT